MPWTSALIFFASLTVVQPALAARPVTRADAARAAIHPVVTPEELRFWLDRVPQTREWPPDFAESLAAQGPVLAIEMSTAPECLPCADLWRELSTLSRRYGWQLRTIGESEAMVRSGRLGLPWVGHPVAWVRPLTETNRIIPIAVGADRAPNLARNLYLAAKMLAGVRPSVGVRGMAKFTGIVGSDLREKRAR